LEVRPQDWKKTGTEPGLDQSGPEFFKTDEDRNRGPVFGLSKISKTKDRGKTGLTGLNQSF
jgi:hypothetical protein